jgi:short-chain Z-isoprenyl diphosphate synthase
MSGTGQGILYNIYERRLLRAMDASRLPRHIGVILDGHRRFARAEGLTDYAQSYQRGMRRFEEFLGWAQAPRIPAITAWVLSPQNLERPRAELDPYFEVLINLFGRLPELAERYDLRLRAIGRLDLLPDHLRMAAKSLAEARPEGTATLNIALSYGGREEIVDAARSLVDDLVGQGVAPSELGEGITVESLASHMYSADIPDADLLIRTSGESRLSGFLLWQSAYAEYAFVDVFWPAFRRVDYLRALRDFAARERRFGR